MMRSQSAGLGALILAFMALTACGGGGGGGSDTPPATTFALTVSVTGTGSVSSAPAGIACPGDCTESYASTVSVLLTAAPSGGFAFSNWGGACAGTALTCNVAMSAARNVTATLLPWPQTMT